MHKQVLIIGEWVRFLHRIKTETNDKIVLISNYTQTLDMFEKMLRSKKYGCGRRVLVFF